MDKEAEKIARGLPKNPYPNQHITDLGLTTNVLDREIEASRIAYMEAQQDMIKAGYRKLPENKHCDKHSHFVDECPWCQAVANEGVDWQAKDKPPLLRYQTNHKTIVGSNEWHNIEGYNLGTQAQREADIKWYEGAK